MTEQKYLYFWGHTGKEGKVGKECLSQWYPRPFKVNGLEFKTAEHWMMFWKAMLFHDASTALLILEAETPKEAKDLGKTVKGFDPVIWDAHKIEIVTNGNIEKFKAHPDLMEYLLSTGDSILVEASPDDTIWGIGMTQDNPLARDPKTWKGKNLLGKCLTNVKLSFSARFKEKRLAEVLIRNLPKPKDPLLDDSSPEQP